MSKILGLDGKPIKEETLNQEVLRASITGISKIWGGESVTNSITPAKLATIIKDANSGDATAYLSLAEEMEEKDLHYRCELSKRKLAVTSLPINVESASESAEHVKQAEEIRQLTREPEFRDMLEDLMDGLGKGYSVAEIRWNTITTPWKPTSEWINEKGEWIEKGAYIWRDPRLFQRHPTEPKALRIRDKDKKAGLAMARYRFITHIPKLKSGIPIRGGLARLAAVAYMCKSYTLTDWVAFAEVFGMPLRIGRYGANAKNEDIRTLINAVANIGSDAAAVIPDSMRIDFEDGNRGSNGAIFKDLAEWLDKQVSKGVLGQTGSSEGTPGQLGDNDTMADVRDDIKASDARQLENTLNRDLIKTYIDLNYGPQEAYPRVQLYIADPEDIAALTNAVEKLVPLGLQVAEDEIRDRLNLRAPKDGEAVLQLAAPQPTTETANNHQQGCQCGQHSTAINRAQQITDDLAQLIDDGLDGWQPQMQPVIDPIQQLVASANSFEEFAAGLPGLLNEMDSTQLVNALALQAFKARGVGDAGD